MPPQGVESKPHTSILSFEDILRICGIMADLGIRKIKVTGGEPLVRKGTTAFIHKLKAIPGIEQVTITTNGILLENYLDELAAVPLAGINVSLDALNPEVFRHITRCNHPGYPDAILHSIERVRSLGMPVKINCVPQRGLNHTELADIAALAEKTVNAVRFIELMPLGCAGEMEPIPGAELRSILQERFGSLKPVTEKLGNGPAVYYEIPGFAGKIGLINAVTEGFCESCNRLRLTPEGLLKPCLSSNIALDLQTLLHSGASDAQLMEAIQGLAAKKPVSHNFSDIYGNKKENHTDKVMSGIGG
jgi:cyclic pyranopterin phosphate synthase